MIQPTNPFTLMLDGKQYRLQGNQMSYSLINHVINVVRSNEGEGPASGVYAYQSPFVADKRYVHDFNIDKNIAAHLRKVMAIHGITPSLFKDRELSLDDANTVALSRFRDSLILALSDGYQYSVAFDWVSDGYEYGKLVSDLTRHQSFDGVDLSIIEVRGGVTYKTDVTIKDYVFASLIAPHERIRHHNDEPLLDMNSGIPEWVPYTYDPMQPVTFKVRCLDYGLTGTMPKPVWHELVRRYSDKKCVHPRIVRVECLKDTEFLYMSGQSFIDMVNDIERISSFTLRLDMHCNSMKGK